MIKKSDVKGSDKVQVTFAIHVNHGAQAVAIAGDFNEWSPEKLPMKLRKDGLWSASIRLPRDREFQYRLVVDGANWVADPENDVSAPNPFGGANSILAT